MTWPEPEPLLGQQNQEGEGDLQNPPLQVGGTLGLPPKELSRGIKGLEIHRLNQPRSCFRLPERNWPEDRLQTDKVDVDGHKGQLSS